MSVMPSFKERGSHAVVQPSVVGLPDGRYFTANLAEAVIFKINNFP